MRLTRYLEQKDEPVADPKLYRTYWDLMMLDILYKLGFSPTKRNKEILHEFHKRVLGYNTIAGRRQDVVSRFLFDVGVFWSMYGIFVRTSKKQPWDIEFRPLSEIKHLL